MERVKYIFHNGRQNNKNNRENPFNVIPAANF